MLKNFILSLYILLITILGVSFTSNAAIIKSKTIEDSSFNEHSNGQLNLIKDEIKRLNYRIDGLKNEINKINRKIEKKDNIDQKNQNLTKREPISSSERKNLEKSSISSGSEKSLYDVALSALKDKDFEVAANKFEEFIELYTDSGLISNVHFWYGETFFKQRIYDKAALQFLKCYKKSTKGPKSADALIRLANSLSQLGKSKDACAIVAKFFKEFPKSKEDKLKKMKDLEISLKCK